MSALECWVSSCAFPREVGSDRCEFHDGKMPSPAVVYLYAWGNNERRAELKGERGVMSREQDEWLEVLRAAGAAVAVFKPRDWMSGTVEAVLRGC